jgi:hypothetical protein
MPGWAGVDVDAFMAGFALAEAAMGAVFAALLSWHLLRRLLSAAGL